MKTKLTIWNLLSFTMPLFIIYGVVVKTKYALILSGSITIAQFVYGFFIMISSAIIMLWFDSKNIYKLSEEEIEAICKNYERSGDFVHSRIFDLIFIFHIIASSIAYFNEFRRLAIFYLMGSLMYALGSISVLNAYSRFKMKLAIRDIRDIVNKKQTL